MLHNRIVEPAASHVLSLGRRVDATSAPGLEAECCALLENNELRLVVLDMSDLEYISSAGLKVILFLAQSLRPRQGEVRFVALKPQVRDIFSMSGFMSLFQEYSSVASALDARAPG